MHTRATIGRRGAAALVLGLLLLTGPVMAGAARPSALQLDVTGAGGARRAGDHESVTATVTNTGTQPLDQVLLMLSLADVTHTPAIPLGLEDWTPDPGAARAAALGPGERLSRTWRLRMIQAGRVAVYATAMTGGASAVTNSRPVFLAIAPTRNLTLGRVLPVILGIPLALLGAVLAVLRRRSRPGGSPSAGNARKTGAARVAAAMIAILAPAILGMLAGPTAASPADTASEAVGTALRPSLTIAPAIASAKTGDRLTVTAWVTNTTGRPLSEATLLLGLVDTTPGQAMPQGLETWTADPESVALPALAPGASASATWDLVMTQPGTLGLYASVMPGPGRPVRSSPLTVLSVRDVRVLNPRSVLPIALGEPVLLLVGIGLLWARRSSPVRPPMRRGPDDAGGA